MPEPPQCHADSHSLKEAEQDHRLECLRENEHDARNNKSCEPEQQYEPSAVPIAIPKIGWLTASPMT